MIGQPKVLLGMLAIMIEDINCRVVSHEFYGQILSQLHRLTVKMSKQNVFPLRYFDDTPLWRAFVLYYMFVFDSVLDPEKLKSSLELLASRQGWMKFGARIRKNVKLRAIRIQRGLGKLTSIRQMVISNITSRRPHVMVRAIR